MIAFDRGEPPVCVRPDRFHTIPNVSPIGTRSPCGTHHPFRATPVEARASVTMKTACSVWNSVCYRATDMTWALANPPPEA